MDGAPRKKRPATMLAIAYKRYIVPALLTLQSSSWTRTTSKSSTEVERFGKPLFHRRNGLFPPQSTAYHHCLGSTLVDNSVVILLELFRSVWIYFSALPLCCSSFCDWRRRLFGLSWNCVSCVIVETGRRSDWRRRRAST